MTAQKKFLIPIICFSSLCIAMDVTPQQTIDPKEQAVLKILAENGDINQRFKQFNNQRPLLFLADDDKYHATLLLLLKKKNLIIRTNDMAMATALHRAARKNAILNLKAIIDHCKTNQPFEFSSFLNACTIFKKTALHEAVEYKNQICVGILLSHGAYLNQETAKGLSEVHILLQEPFCSLTDAEYEKRIKILLLLYVYGADLNNKTIQKNAFLKLDNCAAWNDTQRLKKQQIQTLIKNLKLTTEFENKAKNYLYFQSLLPTDTRWNIYDFVLGRYVPRHTRL